MKQTDKFEEMVKYGHYGEGKPHRLVSSMGKAMLNKPENERGSVISTMDSVLGIYKDPVTARNTERSDFHILDIMNRDKPVSLYLITTPDNKDRLCPLLRLLINMMLKKLAAKVNFEDGRTVMAHKHRLLMMLDEFPSFGKLQPIADGLAFIAGYGLKVYLISQDTVQFDAIYGDKNSIISNCHIQVCFPPNRLETAKYISQMLGETTVVERQFSMSGKRAGMMHGQVTESIHANKRPLLTPDEVMAMPGPIKNGVGDIVKPGEMIIRVAGAAPIRGLQSPYFMDKSFLARAKIPAPERTDRIYMELENKTDMPGPKEPEGEKKPEQEKRPEPERQPEQETSAVQENRSEREEQPVQGDQPVQEQRSGREAPAEKSVPGKLSLDIEKLAAELKLTEPEPGIEGLEMFGEGMEPVGEEAEPQPEEAEPPPDEIPENPQNQAEYVAETAAEAVKEDAGEA